VPTWLAPLLRICTTAYRFLTLSERYYSAYRYLFINDYHRDIFPAYRVEILYNPCRSFVVCQHGVSNIRFWHLTPCTIRESISVHPIKLNLIKYRYRNALTGPWLTAFCKNNPFIWNESNCRYPRYVNRPSEVNQTVGKIHVPIIVHPSASNIVYIRVNPFIHPAKPYICKYLRVPFFMLVKKNSWINIPAILYMTNVCYSAFDPWSFDELRAMRGKLF